jgi:thiol:disulfide interchange protein DsbD
MRSSIRSSLLLCLLVLIGWSQPLRAATPNPLKIQLVAAHTTIEPGKPFYVGLHLDHPPGYHTYWKNPGIVGMPTAFVWNLPPGWKAADIEWPAPERVLMFKIKAQGLHGEKILPIRLTPPANLPAGPVTLDGKARWMCCSRNCSPGFQDLSIDLVVSKKTPVPDSRWTKLFKESLESVPRSSTHWTTRVERRGNQFILRIQPATPAAKTQFAKISEVTFFTEDGVIDPNQPATAEKTANAWVLTQTLSTAAPEPLPEKLTGLLQAPEGWLPSGHPKFIRFTAPIGR